MGSNLWLRVLALMEIEGRGRDPSNSWKSLLLWWLGPNCPKRWFFFDILFHLFSNSVSVVNKVFNGSKRKDFQHFWKVIATLNTGIVVPSIYIFLNAFFFNFLKIHFYFLFFYFMCRFIHLCIYLFYLF